VTSSMFKESIPTNAGPAAASLFEASAVRNGLPLK